MEKVAVYSDNHGHPDLLKRAVDDSPDDVHWVRGGDSIDGPYAKELLDFERELYEAGMLTVIDGNHEWAAKAALIDVDPERRRMRLLDRWATPPHKKNARMERGTFDSYGINKYWRTEERAKALHEIMNELGHMALLESARMYFENSELVVVHAGLDAGQSWAAQRAHLDMHRELASDRLFVSEPRQLFSFEYADSWHRPRDLRKTLVTGHSHLSASSSRISREGVGSEGPIARVKTASHLWKGDPLCVYESWNRRLVFYPQR